MAKLNESGAKQLLCPLRQAAIKHPTITACVSEIYGEVNFYQLDALVETYRQQLHIFGLTAGQKLLWSGENSLALIITILASMRSGVVIIPLNHKLAIARQLALIDTAAPDAIYSDDESLFTTLQTQTKLTNTLRFITPPLSISTEVNDHRRPLNPLWIEGDRTLDLLFTSGSSGDPKAVAHSINNHLANAQGSQQRIPLRQQDRWLLSLPLAHIGGMAILFRCLNAGATLAIAEQSNLAKAITQLEISHLSLVATQLYRLLTTQDKAELKTLRYLLLGGSAIDESLLERAKTFGLNCYTSYGMTEMSSQICTGPGLGHNIVGNPLPGAEIKLANDGEVLVRGGMLAQGYLRQQQLMPLTDTNGWFATGDLGEMTSQGLRLLGRKDNRFICGGENIVPELIEQLLLQHPAINRAVVVAQPDPEWGHRPVALTNPIEPSLQQDLNNLIRSQLGSLWVPVAWHILPEQEPSLKPNRKQLACSLLSSS